MTHKELIEKHRLTSVASRPDGLMYNICPSLYMSYSIVNDQEVCKLLRTGRFKDGRYIDVQVIISGSINTMNRYLSCDIMIRKIKYEDQFRYISTGNQIKI